MQIKNVRFIIAAITTLSAYAVYVSRVNLSIAIIAMVDDGHQHATSAVLNSNSSTQDSVLDTIDASQASSSSPSAAARHRRNSGENALLLLRAGSNETTDKPPPPHSREPFAINFPASKKSLFKAPLISQVKFHWDQTEQGHILGAFFYGYILFQIPGARMAESVGARWILMAATAGSALISLIFPLSTQLNSIHLLMVLRFVMGLCQSAFFPAAYVFFCRWLPEHERSVLLPIMFIGSNMGSISTYILSSYLISSSYGWPSVFYVSGLICLLVTFFWFLFGSNGPHDNWLITDEERDYILTSIDQQNSTDVSDARRRKLSVEKNSSLMLNNLSPRKQADKSTSTTSRAGGTHSNLLLANSTKLQQLAPGAGAKLLAKSKSANDLIPVASQSFNNNNNNNNYNNNKQQLSTIVDTEANNKNTNPSSSDPLRSAVTAVEPARELCWFKLLRSVPVWTLILSMYGNEWSQVVLTYELPTYLNTALSFPIEQNGVINSFFQLSYTLASPIMSSLGAYLLDRHLLKMRKIHVRKLFQSLATFGQLACFLSVPICGANRGLIIMFMFSATVFKACANAGDIMVPGDLSPEYAGTVFALANSIGNTAGFFVPLLAGFIVNNAYEREQWTPFWLTSASIMCFSGLIFLIFGQTKRQDFSIDSPQASPKASPPTHRSMTAAAVNQHNSKTTTTTTRVRSSRN